jgi:hypothetical protein
MAHRRFTTETYTDSEGKTWVKIINFWSLSADMMIKYGKGWKKKALGTYGFEQLFINQYDSKGRKI